MMPCPIWVKKQKGFTLIELLISITIIVIITAAIIPSFSGYIKGQSLKQMQEQVKSDLRSMQNKALTGALSDQLIGGEPITHWAVRFIPGSTTYDFFVATSASTCSSAQSLPADQLQGQGNLSAGMIVYGGNYKCIFFSVANGSITTKSSTGNSFSSIVVKWVGVSTEGSCRTIKFNDNGLIYSDASTTCP